MRKILAFDIDALWDGNSPRETAVDCVSAMRECGYRFVWVTNDTEAYVRRAEIGLGVDRKQDVLTNQKSESFNKSKSTMYSDKQVEMFVGCLPMEMMTHHMRALPCNNYIKFKGIDTLGFMLPPAEA